MSVRTTSFAVGAFTVGAGGFVDLYTVPADRTAIVKDVRVFPLTAVGGGLLVWQTPGGAVGHLETIPGVAGALYVTDPTPWAVGLEGWLLRLYGTPADQARWLVSGTLLFGDPA